jgi:peptide/nickel transport system permease protein
MSRLQVRSGLCLTGFVLLFALFGPYLSQETPYQQNLAKTLLPPAQDCWLGSDHLGRSVYSRLASGAKYSLIIASLTVCISCATGSLLGIAAGYWEKWIDTFIMRLVDLTLAFPGILLAIILAGLLGGSMPTLVFALTVSLWCDYCRLARNITRSIKASPHMEAGKLLGFHPFFLIRQYIVPYVLPQLGILASLSMGRTILNIAGLGFLGIGLKPPLPEWGGMISEGLSYLVEAPWLVVAPGLMIFTTVLGFQLLAGDLLHQK